MKTPGFLAPLLLAFSLTNAQNLVPNPGFENLLSCPVGGGDIYLAEPWYTPPNTMGTPDIFHPCNTIGQGNPLNGLGYQAAHSGHAYAGIFVFGFNIREYIEVMLLQTLVQGHIYEFKMFVSLAEQYGLGIAIDSLGVLVSTSGTTGGGGFALFPQHVPQISNPANNMLIDTTSWTLVTGTYIAQGGEHYITIGNFNSDGATNTALLGSFGNTGYYYIDDVSLIDLGVTSIGHYDFPECRIYPVPFNDVLSIELNTADEVDITIYDSTSRIKLHNSISGKQTFVTSALKSGIYMCVLRSKNGSVQTRRIIKQ